MINDYHRPKNLSDAATLLERFHDNGFIVGGGSYISTHQPENGIAIDLQEITELKGIKKVQDRIHIGSLVTLQQMVEYEGIDQELRNAIKYETGRNIRQAATIGGVLVTCDGRSPLAACLLAINVKIKLYSQNTLTELGEWFNVRAEIKHKVILTDVVMVDEALLKFEYSARTPKDRPLVFVAAAVWPDGRTRLTLAGYGSAPILVFDGIDTSGAAHAAQHAYRDAQDFRASAAYRSDVAGRLAGRLSKSTNRQSQNG